MSDFATNNCFNLVVYRTCGWLCAGRPMRVQAHQAPRVITYSARPTKRCLALYTTANRVHDTTPKITEQNRIVRTGKYEAEVTNNIEKNCARGILL